MVYSSDMRQVSKKVATVKTRYGSFSCIFEPERDMGGYAVTAPAVQGAVSWGKTLAEAKRMIVDAIEGVHEARIIAEAERVGTVRLTRARPHANIA